MRGISQDLRYAIRGLTKTPAFTIVAVLTLTLTIAASTTVFSVVYAVLLKPLSFPNSEQLVTLWEHIPVSIDRVGPNPRHVDVWRQRVSAFNGVTLVNQTTDGLLVGADRPRLVKVAQTLTNLFEVLQVGPAQGRSFAAEDGIEGHDHVAILSHRLAQEIFHGQRSALGSSILIGDVSRQVIGVLPENFHFPSSNVLRPFRSTVSQRDNREPDVFVPAVWNLSRLSWNGEYGNTVALGRLAPGFTIQQAQSQLNAVEATVMSDHAIRPGTLRASIQPLQATIVTDARPVLWLLLAAVIGLTLIGCLNLANAQLGRALSREHEAAVRAAMGAPRWRIAWNAMSEGVVLSLLLSICEPTC